MRKIVFTTMGLLAGFCHLALGAELNGIQSNPIESSEAQPNNRSVSTPEQMQTEAVSPWEIGIAAGFGTRTNPLVYSEDIDLNLIVHIAYFGERFFFDNGDLGFNLYANDWVSINAIAGVNSERQYFEHINRVGLVLRSSAQFDPGVGTVGDIDESAVANNDQVDLTPPDRDTPMDAGIEILIDEPWGSLQLQWLTDASDKHNGQEVYLSYAYPFRGENFWLTPSVGWIYKNERWSNYFYGVSDSEVVRNPIDDSIIRDRYFADDANNVFFKIQFNYAINSQWRVVGLYEREYLDKTITKSPIVDEQTIDTSFLGLYYQF